MIVRERPGFFVLIQQHDHALAAGEFARRWAKRPRPYEPAILAVASHDVAWKGLDSSIRWNEDTDRPYPFVDYPADEKLRAYTIGLDSLESESAYAACLCSMHYGRLMREFGRSDADARFVASESRRQEKLKLGMDREELENLERNLSLLRLCDGLSLFVCLNEPGSSGYPPPYPGGFLFDDKTFQPVWEDPHTLYLEPNPLSEPFEISIPYQEIGKDRRPIESGRIELRITL